MVGETLGDKIYKSMTGGRTTKLGTMPKYRKVDLNATEHFRKMRMKIAISGNGVCIEVRCWFFTSIRCNAGWCTMHQEDGV